MATDALAAGFPSLALVASAKDVPWRTGMVARGPRELLVTW
ncbi:MAG TPA: hypothetical protein VFM55_27290 [Micromonosporaceae bacterium]|nr:hypothetical protein [Micromonosporaceae bacterium]